MTIETGLIGHWKFQGDSRDSSGQENHGRAHRVDFSAAGRDGKPGTAAFFNGVDACVEVKDKDALHLGTGDFSAAAWIRLEQDMEDVIGDILTKYDETTRRGFNLYVKGSSASYNSQGDEKHLHFGIDNAMESPWEDCGKPWPSNMYVGPLTVFKGALYAGIADAARDEDACHVMRYAGGQEWVDCGRVCDCPKTRSAYSFVVHKGDLYCGTGRYDWTTAQMENCTPVHVYRYAGGKEWVDCGQVGEHNTRVLSLATFKGELYAGVDNMKSVKHAKNIQRVYHYLGDKKWEPIGDLNDNTRALCLGVHNGALYCGTGDRGEIFRYDGGSNWSFLGAPFRNSQVHSLQVHKGKLFAGTWADGFVCSFDGGMNWTDCGLVGITEGPYARRVNEINELTVYNGKLYAGVIPLGQVYRWEGGTRWTMLRRLVSNPDWEIEDSAKWARVPSLTEFGGRLYAGTASCRGYAEENGHPECGRVYSWMAGQSISYDDDLGAGWTHVAAVREGGSLRLYLNGKVVSASGPFSAVSYDLTNRQPLYIGFGAVDFFSGAMQDMRLYNRALAEGEVKQIAEAK